MESMDIRMNKYQTPLTEELLSSLPDEIVEQLYDYINNKPKRQDPYKEIKLTLDEKYLNTWMTIEDFEILRKYFEGSKLQI